MDNDKAERIEYFRQAFASNPNDRQTVLDASRFFRDIGEGNLAADLLIRHLYSHPGDPETATLAMELKVWMPSFPIPGPDGSIAKPTYAQVSRCLDSVIGYLLKDQERLLFEKVKSLPDGAVIVEMGCNKGKSTVAMAFACMGTDKHVYSIDTYTGNEGQMGKAEDFQEEWAENLRKFGLESYATPLKGYTFEVVPDRSRYPAPDFVFIDASHEFTDVVEDFRSIYPYVKDGGWISFHDVEAGWPGPWRVWKEYARHLLTDHEFSTTLACGRKVAGRPFGRDPATETNFPFAKELLAEFSEKFGAEHPLVQAMSTSLTGDCSSLNARKEVLRAENHLAEAPEKEFHAVLTDMVFARDGRIDGHIRLWLGLSLLGQERFPEALAQFQAAPRVSIPLARDRTQTYLEFIKLQLKGASIAEPARKESAAIFQPHILPTDTVFALGGDGFLLASLQCSAKVGIELVRETRRRSITEYGVDSLEFWEELPGTRADVIVSDQGMDAHPAPLIALKQARGKLKAGGKAVFLAGGESGAGEKRLYSWTRETLSNLFSAAGFLVKSVEAVEPGSDRLILVATRD